MRAELNHRQKHIKLVRSLRHSKFGTCLQIKREDGSLQSIRNLYQPSFSTALPSTSKQLKQPQPRTPSNDARMIPHSVDLVSHATLSPEDKQLLAVLKNYLKDLLANSFCSLIEELNQYFKAQPQTLEEDDRTHMLLLQTYMMQVCLLQKQGRLNIAQIGVSLQFNSFDFLFASLYKRITRKTTKSDIKD